MAYSESNGHVLDDVTCPVFLFGTDYILARHCVEFVVPVQVIGEDRPMSTPVVP